MQGRLGPPRAEYPSLHAPGLFNLVSQWLQDNVARSQAAKSPPYDFSSAKNVQEHMLTVAWGSFEWIPTDVILS